MSALECHRRGFSVRVFEKTADVVTSGDSFAIGPTASNAVKKWPWMSKRCEEIEFHPLIAFHDASGKRQRGPINFDEMMSKQIKNPPRMGRHSRPKFHAMLIEQLSQVGIHVEYGKEAMDYGEEADRAYVRLKDGSKYHADLVIAAEGVGSTSGSIVGGQPVRARRTGDAVFRASWPVELALADPLVAETFEENVVQVWSGEGFFGIFARGKEDFSIGIVHPDKGTAEESWSQRVSHDDVLALTKAIPNWPEVGTRAITSCPEDLLIDYKLVWRDPQPTWTSPAGRVVQLGDAAHTFLPQSGNGATQAIEDAVSLATCLALAGSREKIAGATRVHNKLRFERVSCLQAFGVSNSSKFKKKADSMHMSRWIVEHDPEKYAEENYGAALQCLEQGQTWVNTNTPPGMTYTPWTIDTLLEAQERGEPTVLDGDWA